MEFNDLVIHYTQLITEQYHLLSDQDKYLILGVVLSFVGLIFLIRLKSKRSKIEKVQEVSEDELPDGFGESDESIGDVQDEPTDKKLDEENKSLSQKDKELEVLKPVQEVSKSKSWKDRLTAGLSSTRTGVWGKLENIFSSKKLDEDTLDQIEELLYSADMGHEIIDDITDNFKKEMSKADSDFSSFKAWTKQYLKNKLDPVQRSAETSLFNFTENSGLKVIMVVGVNGAGKTTTIGKLATKLNRQGAKVVVGACDTFRAAAVEQLEVWCKRAGVEIIKAGSGADPSGVAYDTLAKAKSLNADYCILDTAGRLHTAQGLMDELSKTKNVLSKVVSTAPDQTLLVIDSITGQNALAQAKEFNKALDLTGLILTKCDGSSKAGNAISMASSLAVPITYIGVGEDVEDLEIFNTDEYLDALLG
mgnify:CR=1 FL=1